MTVKKSISRRSVMSGGAAGAVGFIAAPWVRAASPGKLEKTSLTVALAVDAASFLPIYVAAARTWKEQGLDVQLTAFRGDAEAAQALAGGSVDVTVQSPDALINLIASDQPVTGFYAGFWQADYAWLSQPAVKTWEDLRGGTVAISTFGSQTEQLTTYALKRHGLIAQKDVQLIQAGPPPTGGFQALKAGRVSAGIQSPPGKWIAQEEGFNLLGTQVEDVAPQWPKHVFIAGRKFLDANPNTMRALLRAHVAAIRLARAEQDTTIKVLMDRLKFSEINAGRTYAEMMPGYDERGRFPKMDVYWEIQMQAGTVKEPWPDAKLLDQRFIESFAEWAP
jgi:ABC-type nitrate/sulfonate/bicarbonate transport system substrate-binding protein